MNQGEPLSPMIFYMVEDMILQHWVLVVAELEEDTGTEGFGQDVQRLAA